MEQIAWVLSDIIEKELEIDYFKMDVTLFIEISTSYKIVIKY